MRRYLALLALGCVADDWMSPNSMVIDDEDEGMFERRSAAIDRVTYDTVSYVKPSINCMPDKELCETFDSGLSKSWRELEDKEKYGGKWEIQNHPWMSGGNGGLKMTGEMQHHGLSRSLSHNWNAGQDPVVFSMDVRFAEDHSCGGGYIKLFQRTDESGQSFDGTTPYSIMFGPDRCGATTRKLHLIFQYKEANGRVVEEHLKDAIELPNDLRKTHQYGFVLNPADHTVKVMVDGEMKVEGQLKTLTSPGWKSASTIDDPTDTAPDGWTPPPRKIADTSAVKPEDWDETEPETIPDTDAVMPDDWLEHEAELVPNEAAVKPEGWDEAEDGQWIRPMMKNPKCASASGCGPWETPVIPNPKYRGIWSAPMIPNPEFTEKYPTRQIPHPSPYDSMNPATLIPNFNTIGLELWTVQAGTIIDNILLSSDADRIAKWVASTYDQVSRIEDENYRRMAEATKDERRDTGNMPEVDRHRYVKLGAGIMMVSVILIIAVRRIFYPPTPTTSSSTTESQKNKENSPQDKNTPTEKATAGEKAATAETEVTKRAK